MDTPPRNGRVIRSKKKHQPDPMLQMSIGRMGAGAVTLAAIVAVVVLGVAFYGLNASSRIEQAASSPSAQSAQPQAGGNSREEIPVLHTPMRVAYRDRLLQTRLRHANLEDRRQVFV